MRAVIQRVTQAQVDIDGQVHGAIKNGFMVLLGVCEGDGEREAVWIADKIFNMRVFCDDNDKMNLSLTDIGGDVLIISQFTLHADCKKGNRPSFIKAARPETAEPLYEFVCRRIEENLGYGRVKKGIFGAGMKVSLTNDGPVTIILDSDIYFN
jgi:D-tyrosyl-tRNA(Tyr) deacylase